MKKVFYKVHEFQEEGFLYAVSRCKGVRATKIQTPFTDSNFIVRGSKEGLHLLFMLWVVFLIKDFDEDELDEVLRHLMKLRNIGK